MKYIFVSLLVVSSTIIFAMEHGENDQISSPQTRKIKNCWWATGTEIIINDEYCKRREEFSQIVADCSCDILHDLLYCAVKLPHGAPYVRELFTRKDCCPCGRTTDANTPLRVAIAGNGSLETIQFLIEKGGSTYNNTAINSPGTVLKTPLEAAAYYGRDDVIQVLMKQRDSIDLRTIKLIQKKCDALDKLTDLATKLPEKKDSLKSIKVAQNKWRTIRKKVKKRIQQEAESLSQKS